MSSSISRLSFLRSRERGKNHVYNRPDINKVMRWEGLGREALCKLSLGWNNNRVYKSGKLQGLNHDPNQ